MPSVCVLIYVPWPVMVSVLPCDCVPFTSLLKRRS